MSLQKKFQIDVSNYVDKVPEGETPLWQYWEEFVEDWIDDHITSGSIPTIKRALIDAMSNLEVYSIEGCNSHVLYRKKMKAYAIKRGWKNSTFNKHKSALNSYFKWLESYEYIAKNKVQMIRKRAEHFAEQRVMDSHEMEILLQHIFNRRQKRVERWRNILLVQIIILTGARAVELLSLTKDDIVKMKNGNYKLKLHGAKQKARLRVYDLGTSIRDTFEMYMKVRDDLKRDEDCLFISTTKRGGLTSSGLISLWDRLSKELGFRVNSRAIRRFVATKLNSKGLVLDDIANHLGHTNVSTTKIYIQRNSRLTEKGTKIMSAML